MARCRPRPRARRTFGSEARAPGEVASLPARCLGWAHDHTGRNEDSTMVMTAKETDNPGRDGNLVLVAARALLHRGDDGGVPINRNDVGYNKVDYGQVKALLGRFERDGRASSVWLIYLLNILRKYRRQLGEMGFDPEALANAAGQEWVGTPVPRGAIASRDALDAVLDTDESPEREPEPDAPVIPPMRDVLGPA